MVKLHDTHVGKMLYKDTLNQGKASCISTDHFEGYFSCIIVYTYENILLSYGYIFYGRKNAAIHSFQ
jgi:hypothetical protein